MIEIPEIITLVLGFASLIFVGANRQQIRKVPFSELILLSYLTIFLSLVLTILEEFIWGNILNLFEHVGYLLSSLLLAVWCWKVAFVTNGQSKK